MALTFADRVKETSTTAGTGTLTLAGAAFGFQSFAAIGNANTTYYAIYDGVSGDWEVGIGTYTVSGTTLSRDTVLSSSNAGALVVFSSATKEVFVTYPSERAVYKNSANTYTVQQAFDALTSNSIALTTGTVSTTPSAGTDLVNKSYVDTVAAQGIVYHDPVYVESPVALTALYNQPGGPGVGVGATLTNNGTKAALVIDGVLMTTTKRVLIYNQTNAFENGVYTVTTVGTPDPGGTNWVLTRATDADTYAVNSPTSLGQGDAFFVTAGNTGAGELYSCNTVGVITFGTTNITFAQISATVPYFAGTGLNLNPATTFNITNTGVTAATYGAAATVPVIVVNAQGQITSATNTAIAIPATQVSGLAASATTDTTNAANITSGTLPSGRLIGGYTQVTAVGTLVAGTWNASIIPILYGGTGSSTATGSGSVVLATSPTLTTPNLGTPSALVGTNITGTAAGLTAGAATTATTATTANALNTANSYTVTSLTATSATGKVSIATDGGGNVSLGRTDGVASTPFLDFNSGATAVDYDVRVQASGGNGTSGKGTLTVTGTLAATTIQSTNGLVVNSNTVAISYSIPSGSSAMSAGPMTVNGGITVTVPSGSRWVVI